MISCSDAAAVVAVTRSTSDATRGVATGGGGGYIGIYTLPKLG